MSFELLLTYKMKITFLTHVDKSCSNLNMIILKAVITECWQIMVNMVISYVYTMCVLNLVILIFRGVWHN